MPKKHHKSKTRKKKKKSQTKTTSQQRTQPILSNWISKLECNSSPPSKRMKPSLVVHENSLYLFGGYDYSLLNDFYKYSISKKQWSVIKDVKGSVPSPRTVHTAVKRGNTMIIFGGLTEKGFSNELFEYDFQKHQWSLMTTTGDLPTGRGQHSAVVTENAKTMLVFGGFNQQMLNDLVKYNFKCREWKKVNIKGVELPRRAGHSAVVIGHSMFIFGGNQDQVTVCNELFEFDISTQQWRCIEQYGYVPSPRYNHTAVLSDKGNMIIFGGYGFQRNNDLYEFNKESKRWIKLVTSGDVPSRRHEHCAVFVNKSMIVFGGNDGEYSNEMWEFRFDNCGFGERLMQLLGEESLTDIEVKTTVLQKYSQVILPHKHHCNHHHHAHDEHCNHHYHH